MNYTEKKLYSAIVGAGTIATGIGEKKYPMTHVRSYMELSGHVELIAFAETDKAQRTAVKKAFPQLRAYEDFDSLVNNEQVDILSICTPDDSHYELLVKAINRRVKGIWCEKPMALDGRSAEEISGRSRESGILVQINYFRRFIPEIAEIRSDIIRGLYGKIKMMSGLYTGGYVRNGSHMIDLMNFFEEEFSLMHAQPAAGFLGGGDGPVYMVCKTRGGIYSILQPLSGGYNIFELDIFCENARIRICENGRRIEIYHVMSDKEFPHLNILNPEPETVICRWKDSFTRALANLIEAVEGNGDSTFSPPEDSVKTAKLIGDVTEVINKQYSSGRNNHA
ncbi:MAG: Gfo/Idh/MocA family oxidoreductase [Nitrospirae bacterium]|nr:Gfo/Idh/MocA family oxidoreductase [Nitrospirota bacterium]